MLIVPPRLGLHFDRLPDCLGRHSHSDGTRRRVVHRPGGSRALRSIGIIHRTTVGLKAKVWSGRVAHCTAGWATAAHHAPATTSRWRPHISSSGPRGPSRQPHVRITTSITASRRIASPAAGPESWWTTTTAITHATIRILLAQSRIRGIAHHWPGTEWTRRWAASFVLWRPVWGSSTVLVLSIRRHRDITRVRGVERSAIIVAIASSRAEGGERWSRRVGGRRARRSGLLGLVGWRRPRSRGRGRRVLAVVVILPAHLGVLGDSTLPRFPTDQGPAHGASHHTAGDENDGCRQNNPTTPL